MLRLKHNFFFNGLRVVIAILLIGLLIPASSAFAQTSMQGSTKIAKQLPPSTTRSQIPIAPVNVSPQALANPVQDPSFELYSPNPYWAEYSTNFGTPLCTTTDCPNGGPSGAWPRTGSAWVWFGGVDFSHPAAVSPEVGDLYQFVTFPTCPARLEFYLWVGVPGGAGNVFVALIDGNAVFSANAAQGGAYPGYTLVSVNASAYSDGAAHKVEFYSTVSESFVTFNLDDISLNCLSISGNAGAGGATLSYVDGTLKSVTADGSGNYSIPIPSGWTGTVTPSLAGVTFTPPNRSYSNVTTDRTGENYTASVTLSGNAGVAGATVNYTGGSTVADGSGNYSFTVPWGWTGTVTPSLNADAFCPVSQNYANLATSRTGQNYAHAACPNFSAVSKWTSSFDLSHGWTVADYVRTLGDVSGDGKADLVGFGLDGVYVSVSTGSNFPSPTKWTSSFDLSHGWTVADYVRTVGDVDGDGKADLVGFGQDGVYVSLSTGSSFPTPTKWTSAFDLSHGWTVSQYVRTVGDVSGDGNADLVGFGLDGVYVATSTGSGFNAVSKWTSAFDLTHGWTVAQFVRTVGDVNGDGKADLVGFGLDGVYVATSTGSSFNAVSKWSGGFALANGWTVAQFVRTVGDVDGDGKADIVGFGQDGVYVGLSTGTTFGLGSRRTTSFDLSHGWTVSQYVRTVGDVNGGGKADLVGFGLDGVYVALAQ